MIFPAPSDVIKNVIKSMTINFEFEEAGRWDAKEPIFYMIDRARYLEHYAKDFDVKLKTPAKIHRNYVEVEGDRIDIKKTIIATGFSWRMNERDMLAQTIQYYVNDVKIDEPENIHFYFFKDLIGYAWFFPYGDREAKVGIGGLDKSVEELKVMLDKIVEYLGLNKGKIVKVDGAPIDMGGLKVEWATDPTYVVGEAIGAVMPLTGEGIRPSVLTAKALAHTLTNGKSYVDALKELSIYKASKQQAKILRKVRKEGKVPELKDLSPKMIELIYKFGLGEARLRDFLTLLPSSFSIIKSLF
jgi:flavin-dependent dehydrogenase